MPPLNFCYWRCYTTEPSSFRKMVNIYAGTSRAFVLDLEGGITNVGGGVSTVGQIATGGGVKAGGCTSVDDMFYCGNECEVCDYEF